MYICVYIYNVYMYVMYVMYICVNVNEKLYLYLKTNTKDGS